MSEPTEPSKPRLFERQVRAVWPLSTGADLRFAHASAVSLTPHGYVLEFGVCIVSGFTGRKPDEIAVLVPESMEFNVVARILMPVESAKQLHRFLSERLEKDPPLPVLLEPKAGGG